VEKMEDLRFSYKKNGKPSAMLVLKTVKQKLLAEFWDITEERSSDQ